MLSLTEGHIPSVGDKIPHLYKAILHVLYGLEMCVGQGYQLDR